MSSILVVDDDRLVREATEILLRTKGYDIAVASDGPAAIEIAKARHFDVAIVDVFMPQMDGLKVIQAVRSINKTVSFIAASGFMLAGTCPEMPGFDAMAAEAGAILTLYKPFRSDDLLDAVEKALAISLRAKSAQKSDLSLNAPSLLGHASVGLIFARTLLRALDG